jgi:dTDP-4-dehydrorhamnose reductase
MRILITGANGQVGWALKQLARQFPQHTLIALERHNLDITCKDAVNQTIAKENADIVINAAAYTAVDKAEEDAESACNINRDSVDNLASSCLNADIPLLHISTDYVFNGKKNSPYTETDSPNPLGIYGHSKLAGEQAIAEQLNRFIILRTSWVFGLHGQNFVKTILRLCQDRSELSIIADQFGAPTSASSIAHCLLQICDQYDNDIAIPWGLYHFSNTPDTNWHGFTCKIIDLAQKYNLIDHEINVNKITTEQYPLPCARPQNSCLNKNRITKKLSITLTPWEEELETLLMTLSQQV